MNVVDYGLLVESCGYGEDNIRNGPPLAGKFERSTVKETPTPSGLAVAEMEPLMLPSRPEAVKNRSAGRDAV